MTTTSPWGPQDGPPQPPPSSSMPHHPGAPVGGGPVSPGGPPVQPSAFGPPPGRPSGKPWGLLAAFTGIVIVAVAATAATTYAIAGDRGSAQSPVASTSSPSPQSSAPVASGEGVAAKSQLCQAFDAATRGADSQGPIATDGALNFPVVLRTINSAALVQNSITSQVPDDVANTARSFIAGQLNLVAGATGHASTEELVRLNDASNAATDRFADACGLPR
ncbi:hypothetical protein EV580_6600 [Mycobacterium sp. BK086]|nr:hypothetical protein EV580_6600 [Mycobacterium sp. BK086]